MYGKENGRRSVDEIAAADDGYARNGIGYDSFSGIDRITSELERVKEMKLKEFWMEEDGVGVVEVLLILVVLIGLVIIFKNQINKLVTNIFKTITDQAGVV